MLVNYKGLLVCALTSFSGFSFAQTKIDTLYFPNGKISAKGAYDKNGLETGYWEFYAPNEFLFYKGNLLPVARAEEICTPDSSNCINLARYGIKGTPDGPWVELGPGGQISQQVTLKNGRPDGDWLVYDYWSAALWEKSTWVNGKPTIHYKFDPQQGDTTEITQYLGADTIVHIDFENRILESKAVYVQGNRSETTRYHSNGKPSQVRISDDVIKQATTYDYNEDGKLIRMEIFDFENYVIIKEETYE